jgi:xylulokinase
MPNPQDKYVLAIDLGTSAAKVALVSLHGEVCCWESQRIPLHVLPGGGAEQDPNEWWQAILTLSKSLLGKGLVPVDDVVAVCPNTQGAGTVPVDRDGNCVGNAIIWLDTRGAEWNARLLHGPIRLEGFDVFKLSRWIRITGGLPARSGKDFIGHVLFLKNERPEVYHRAYRLLEVDGYIDYRLSGRLVATPDTMGMSWLTDNRDPNRIVYHDGLIAAAGIDRDKLPEIVRCIDVLGPLRPEVARELGLRPDVQVVAGAFDLPATAVGSGAVDDYAAHLSISTSAFLTVHVPFKKTDLFNMIASLPSAIPGRYIVMGEQEAAGVHLTFLRDNLLFAQDALLNVPVPQDYYPALNQVAAQAPPGSHGLIYTPWIHGERAPVEDPWVRGGIHNLSLGTTRADWIRAIMEGVAFNIRWMLGPIERFCGRRLDPIVIAGGGANSPLWCQIQADVLDRTIRQTKDPIQTAARGAAYMAAVGLGIMDFADIQARVQIQAEYHPDSANRKVYDDLFAEFVNLYKQNKRIYERLNRGRAKER